MLYVYGVVRAGHRAPDAESVGVGDEPVQVVQTDTLGALVSEIPEDQELDDDDAWRHLGVLIAALDDGPVIPLRIATIAPDAEGVRAEVLAVNAAEFAAQLDAFEGMVEVHLDADDEENDAIQAVLSDAVLAGARFTGRVGDDLASRVERGRQVAELVVAHRRRLADQIVERVTDLAVDSAARAQLDGPESPLLRAAFLLERSRLESFDAAVAALRSDFPAVRFTYVGPLPVAHFVGRDVTASAPAADSFRSNSAWGW